MWGNVSKLAIQKVVPKRFEVLSGLATHKAPKNASEWLKMALNRMF